MLFTFPSRYWFTIGHQQYLALERGRPCFPQDSSCPVVLKNTSRDFPLSPTGLSPSVVAPSRNIWLEKSFITLRQVLSLAPCVLQPLNSIGPKSTKLIKFGLFPFRSPLLRESLLISFPRGTKMFQFPRFPPRLSRGAWVLPRQVILLGYPRLSLLDSSPRRFTVLPCPSSAADAKASTLCSFPLTYTRQNTKSIQFLRCKTTASFKAYTSIYYGKFCVKFIVLVRYINEMTPPLFLSFRRP